MDIEVKAMLDDFISPALFEGIRTNYDHPIGFVTFHQPIKLGERSQGLAKTLLHEPADAWFAVRELERSELNRIKRTHRLP